MKNIKLVIIEDEMIVARDLMSNLEHSGFDVLNIFSSGEEFLSQVDNLKPDLILIDIMLNGELNGIQTAEIVNKEKSIPVIFLTAYTEKEKINAALQAGIYGYIVKPYQFSDLKNTINITLSKHQLYKKIEENEKRFHAIVDNSQNGILISDNSGKIIFINREAKNLITQIDGNFLSQGKIQKIIGEEEWQKFQTQFIKTKKEHINIMFPFRSNHQEEIKLSVFCDKIFFSDKENIVFHLYDITEKYNSIQNLRMLATAISSIDECLYITDENNKLLYVNRTFCKKFAYDFYDILGQDIFNLIYRNIDMDILYNIQTIIENNNWSGELEVHTSSNTKIPVFITISIIKETRKYIVGVIRDITDELLLKKQISQVQRLESIGILAGGIAHDFNNLLSIISGYSDLMLSKLDRDDKFWDFLNEIHKAGERAANLTRQLLLFSKTNPGEIEVLNLNDSIHHLFKMLNRIIGENIKLELSLEESKLFIEADKGQIDQIIMNLTVNARDAIHDKKELNNKIKITTESILIDEAFASQNIDLTPGEFVRLTVTDTGKGIPEENIDKIFDPFFTTKGIDQGTGLGLSTVYGIVKKFKGSIFVQSTIDVGTEFIIYFPKSRRKYGESTNTPKSIKQGSGTILIIEDSMQLLHLSEKMLVSLGYDVFTADNGDTALDLCNIHKDKINLVFIDLIMPKYNGIELFNEIKKILTDVKVLYTSGYDDNFLEKYNMKIESQNFIRKPFEILKLSEKISNLLKA